MARRVSATLRLDPADVRALKRARALGISTSDLVRDGLRLAVGAALQAGTRPPRTRLFVTTDPNLGEESHLFQELEAD